MEITTLDQWIAKKIGVDKITQTELRNYQLRQIQRIVNYAAANSKFYRQLYEKTATADLSWQDFAKLPFTCAEDIQNHGSRMVCVEQERVSRIVTLQTSGTTGKPKRIYFTEADQELTIDFFDNGMQTLTQRGDNVLILLPAQTPGCVGDLLRQGLERFGAVAHPYGLPKNFDDALTYMVENNIDSVVANPQQMLAIGQLAREKNLNINLRSILLSTDFVADSLMKQLAEIFNTEVYEHYGITEAGLGAGVSCAAIEGYHMRDADLYFEIINPETGENLPDGSWGEVVFTTLTREAMPLIRYRTGDYGRFLTEPCPCGTALKRMDKVYHRLDSQNFKITDFDEALFAIRGVFNYDLQIDNNNQTIEVNVHVLNRKEDYVSRVIKAVEPLCQGYKTKAKATVGFSQQHYRLQKRKIVYI